MDPNLCVRWVRCVGQNQHYVHVNRYPQYLQRIWLVSSLGMLSSRVTAYLVVRVLITFSGHDLLEFLSGLLVYAYRSRQNSKHTR